MKSRDLIGELRHRLIPALPVPFTQERTIDLDSHIRMAEYIQDMPVPGVAVWAHTGRGLYLTEEERATVLTHWRESLPQSVIVAGAGCPSSNGERAKSDDEYIAHARAMAEHARALGADAILCHPPTRFWDRPEREREEAILQYHSELAKAGLPLILFYLYEAAGGLSYSSRVISLLFNLPNVVGIKIATLDSVMTFQDLATSIKSEYPEKLLISGEDRFLGYSLMAGADSALVGMGSALTALQADMMKAYYTQAFDDFHYRSRYIDRFWMTTFMDPMEGYISRMLYALSWLGVVSSHAVYDPWGPTLSDSDIDRVGDFLTALPTELKH